MKASVSGFLVCGLGVVALMANWKCQPASPASIKVADRQIYSRDQLKVDSRPYEKGVLIMGGSAYNVNVQDKKEDNGDFRLLVTLGSGGAVLEEELYHADEAVFQYRGSGTETFDPPLTLINFPLKSPSSADWNGELKWGGTTLKASAVISTAADPLNLQSGKVDDAILILVKLSITEAPGNVAERDLKFWVAPDRGVVRRDFAAASSREPAGAAVKVE